MGFFNKLFGRTPAPEPAPEPGMVRIACTSTFLHGAARFEAGDLRTVTNDDAAYFCAQGWAHRAGDTGLTVQDGTIPTGDSNG